jgi:hypothetical protein
MLNEQDQTLLSRQHFYCQQSDTLWAKSWGKGAVRRPFGQCCMTFTQTVTLQVSKYVEREILNHKRLIHPHIVQLKEVSYWHRA